MLDAVLRFNLRDAEHLYAELADVVFPAAVGTPQSRAASLLNYLKDLPQDLGIAQSLREVGISESDIPLLAEDAMKQTRLLINNPREIHLSDAIALYKEAL